MKCLSLIISSTNLFWVIATLVVVTHAANEADDHDHASDALCSDVNVTDAGSCAAWCSASNKESEWTYFSEHGDFENFHVDFLQGWTCHCEPAAASTANAEEEQGCQMPYELPTCASKGLADCGANATMTCAELCIEVGLGLANSTTVTTSRRALGHVTDKHYCAHHEHEHRRFLAEEGDDHHEGEEPVTICYCNADQEAAEDSTVACSDADLEGGHDDHGSAALVVAVSRSLTLAAVTLMVAFF